MSRDTIPPHLVAALRAKAAANCPECYGAGIVALAARNANGYREVRCACVDREPPLEDEPGYGAGV